MEHLLGPFDCQEVLVIDTAPRGGIFAGEGVYLRARRNSISQSRKGCPTKSLIGMIGGRCGEWDRYREREKEKDPAKWCSMTALRVLHLVYA